MGKVLKGLEIVKSDLEKINQYTRRSFTADEVYSFSVVLCDNDVDRDNERFTVESLFALEKLFLGKTGIFDHNPKAENQSARIYDCFVEAVSERKTATGDDYFRLVAKAYIPKCKSNEDLILAIDSGILKEVSIGCAVSEKKCSICGKTEGECHHIKGKTYGKEKCIHLLLNPTDAYEWSFVAIPAQKQAGVIKRFNNYKEKFMYEKEVNEILKSLKDNTASADEIIKNMDEVVLNKSQCERLLGIVKSLHKEAQWGRKYKEDLSQKFMKLSAIVQPEVSSETTKSLTQKLSVEQLKEFISAYEKKAEKIIPIKPQLYAVQQENKSRENKAFEI